MNTHTHTDFLFFTAEKKEDIRGQDKKNTDGHEEVKEMMKRKFQWEHL